MRPFEGKIPVSPVDSPDFGHRACVMGKGVKYTPAPHTLQVILNWSMQTIFTPHLQLVPLFDSPFDPKSAQVTLRRTVK